jgi:hypothetical protein
MPLLEQHPEAAGLLAGADDPDLIGQVLSDAGHDCDLVAGLFVQHAAPEDAARLAEGLHKHRDLICDLLRSGLLGAELPFLFHRGTEGEEEYDRWLVTEWQARRRDSDEDRIAFLIFLLDQGQALRDRLNIDAKFRATFRVEVWPRLARVVEGHKGDLVSRCVSSARN